MTWQYKENESGRYLQKVGNGSHEEISLNSDEECGEFLADIMNRVDKLENKVPKIDIEVSKVNGVIEFECEWERNKLEQIAPVSHDLRTCVGDMLKPLIGKRTKVRIEVVE